MEDAKLGPKGTEEERLLRQIDAHALPRHIAIIMDGNGRWARRRRLPRAVGHRSGIQSVRESVEVCARLGVEMLTLYAFSRENWKRPQDEIDTLMGLLGEFVRQELADMVRNNVRLMVIGRLEDLQEEIQHDIRHALEATGACTGMRLCVALSYGGRTEIVDACRSLLRSGIDPDRLDAETFASHLYTAGHPDPDLLIRTSGELRVSNFLLWQIAYAEIWVTETLWPDFRRKQLFEALIDYQQRERRYGGLTPHERGEATALQR